jgi:hypothetical protein
VRDPRLAPFRLPALAFAAFLLVQAVSAAALFVAKLGAGPARVAEFYLGSEERFTAPRSLAGLLEVAVPHLVAIPLVLFAAVHVVGYARTVGPRVFRALVAASFGSALVGIGAGFAVRFVSAELAWVKLLAFGGLEVALLAWTGLLAALFLPSATASVAPPVRAAAEEVAS